MQKETDAVLGSPHRSVIQASCIVHACTHARTHTHTLARMVPHHTAPHRTALHLTAPHRPHPTWYGYTRTVITHGLSVLNMCRWRTGVWWTDRHGRE